MDYLEKIFGGAPRVKLMRLFLFNETTAFLPTEIFARTKVEATRARKELTFLLKVGLVKKINRSNGKVVWSINEKFPYLVEFQRLLLQTSLITPQSILKKLSKIGKLKLVVLSGLFKEQTDSRLDILIVADNAKKGSTESIMSNIEAEVGKEIRFAVLNSVDLKYRLGVGDRLVRDVLDYPHEVVLDKLNLFR
ncbi:MAG: hypothetical protein WCQ00_01425 [bacterium]